ESADSKRRFADLVAVSGLRDELVEIRPRLASEAELLRFHTPAYLERLRTASLGGGGDAGELTPFGHGGYDTARLSAGACIELLEAVWQGRVDNGYALNRPPGHHAEADKGKGFCLLANGVLAIKHLQALHGARRVAVVDWDVHHGNSAQGAFYGESSVLTISIHQDRNFPPDSGHLHENGSGAGLGCNLNIPLPAGSGHEAYLLAFDRVVLPALARYRPEIIVVHSGFDASVNDPLGRMMLHSDSYRAMTQRLMAAADTLCAGKLAMFHEGGYSAAYVPFCGLAVLEELAGVRTAAADPFLPFYRDYPGQLLLPHQQAVIEQAAALVERIPTTH
ncbi:MAG: class II histone deacetylase, partial [Burkholderiales bacterium]|nr:class II histone deacetylase [Burkholderiales bacterium]